LIDKRQTSIGNPADGALSPTAGAATGRSDFALQHGMTAMTSYKMTYLVDKVAMTFINIALLAALPMAAALFVSHSI
jgi:hypothetical protein